MHMTPKEYQSYAKKASPRSPIGKDVVFAFLIGGGICCIGQLFHDLYTMLGVPAEDALGMASTTLVFLSALFTALGLYHKLARFGGAGTLVPITGFANAMVSPAIDFRAEGLITGTAVKMFTVAGPVIVFGTVFSILYGIVLWALM